MSPFPVRRTRPARAAAVGATAGVLLLAGAVPALAAAALVVPLDPSEVFVALLPTENFGELDEAPAEDWGPTPVPVRYGGSVVVDLPEPLDAGNAPLVTLAVGAGEEEPLRTYSSDPAASDPLGVASLGDGAYRVTMPADDGSGDVGLLSVEDLVAVGVDGVDVSPVFYVLDLDAAGPASQALAPEMLAVSSPSCSLDTDDGCAPYQVRAGDDVELTVPATSRLRALGLGTLTDVQAVLEPFDEPSGSAEETTAYEASAVLAAAGTHAGSPQPPAGLLAWDRLLTGAGSSEGPALADAAAAASTRVDAATTETTVGGLLVAEPPGLPVESTEPYRAKLTVPADTAAGSYLLYLTEVAPDTGGTSWTFLQLDVAAVPVTVPVAAPETVAEGSGTPTVVLNPGLRSNTGAEPAVVREPGPEVPPAVLAGAGLLLTALGGGAVLRARRRPAAES